MRVSDNMEMVIRSLGEDHEALFGESSAPRISASEPVLRPYSMVVRVALEWKERRRAVYVKVPLKLDDVKTAGIIRDEYRLLQWFYERLPLDEGYGVVRPLKLYDRYTALVTEEAKGCALDVVMKRYGRGIFPSAGKLSDHYRRCGRWLRKFQSLPVPPFCTSYEAEEAAEFVKGQVKRCRDGGLLNRSLLGRISSFVDEVRRGTDLSGQVLVPMHSDFIPSNIIVREGGISVLDFGVCWSGPACRDVATFLNALDGAMVNPLFRPALIETLKKEFLRGYGWDEAEHSGALFTIFDLREILGRILQLSKRIDGFRSRLMYRRMQMRTEKRLSAIVGD